MTTLVDLPIKIFNNTKTDYDSNEIILGQEPGLFDSIHNHHPELFDLYKRLKSMDWDENEFPYGDCLHEFETCDKQFYDMMIKTLAWQWEADATASRAIVNILGPVMTDSRVWAGYVRINDNECVTPDHEVLTSKGWISIADITKDHYVAQWDYDTREVTFVNPTALIAKEFKGNLINFRTQNRTVDQQVTPNHRMPVIYPYWTTDNVKYHPADKVKYHGGNALPISGSLKHGKGMTPQERLYVAVQADGTLCSDKYTGVNTGYLHYKFGFKKQRKIDRLLDLCTQAGWEVREANVKNKTGIRLFYVYVPQAEFNWDAKTFNWFRFDEITYEWALDFIDELKHWDGNVHPQGATRYITTNKDNATIAMTIGHLIGKRAHISIIPARVNAKMPDGTYSNTVEAYQVYFSKRSYVAGNAITKTEVPYEGNVYCITVPTGYFMVKRGDAISITGNCLHALTYSEIVRNSFKNPQVILDEILRVHEAQERLVTVAKVMGEAHDASHAYACNLIPNDQDLYNKIFKFFMALYYLERIQFMASFAVTFALGKLGMFQPIVMGVQKIAQDEYEIHAQYQQGVIKSLLKTERGMRAYEETKEDGVKLFWEIIMSEVRWLVYLFSEGRELPGVTMKKMIQWALFNGNVAGTFTGHKNEITEEMKDEFLSATGFELEWPDKNPLPYMTEYLDIAANQTSPQEIDNNAYQVNIINTKNEQETFSVDF